MKLSGEMGEPQLVAHITLLLPENGVNPGPIRFSDLPQLYHQGTYWFCSIWPTDGSQQLILGEPFEAYLLFAGFRHQYRQELKVGGSFELRQGPHTIGHGVVLEMPASGDSDR